MLYLDNVKKIISIHKVVNNFTYSFKTWNYSAKKCTMLVRILTINQKISYYLNIFVY